jgi:hypothetical protein
MKKSIFAASLFFAGIAIADSTEVTVDNVIGVMPVNVPAEKTDFILSVPWVAEGGTTNAVAVTNLVKTAGLPSGQGVTTLNLYNLKDTNFTIWNLEDVGGTKYWKDASGTNPDVPVVHQGDALILTITNGTAAATTFYVVGQVGTNQYVQTTIIGAMDESTPTYNMLAPPCATNLAVNVNEFFKDIIDGTIHTNDQIVVDTLGSMTLRFVREYNTTNEVWEWVNEYHTSTPTVPAGRGFWYKRCDPNNLTIKWEAPYVSNE